MEAAEICLTCSAAVYVVTQEARGNTDSLDRTNGAKGQKARPTSAEQGPHKLNYALSGPCFGMGVKGSRSSKHPGLRNMHCK